MRLVGPKPNRKAYPKELKTIGDHIRKRRLDLGLFQRQVAEQIGVDKTSIFSCESNTTIPALRLLPAIIRFLGYNPLAEPKSVSEELVFYRTVRGLSGRRMAELIGVDESTLAKWERGERKPTGKYLELVKGL